MASFLTPPSPKCQHHVTQERAVCGTFVLACQARPGMDVNGRCYIDVNGRCYIKEQAQWFC
jgi:hypothetical protein